MTSCRYCAALSGSRCFLKLIGRLTYQICSSFDSFCARLMAEEEIDEILADLGEAEYLDSTNLGLIAGLAGHQWQKTGKKIRVYAAGDVYGLLAATGLEELMVLEKEPFPDSPDVYREIYENQEKARDLRDIMYSSHQTLAGLNEKNRGEFAALLNLLGKEIKPSQ